MPDVASISAAVGVPLVPHVLTIAGFSAFVGLHGVVGFSAVAFIPAVAGVSAVAGVPAVDGSLLLLAPCQSWRPYVIVAGVVALV